MLILYRFGSKGTYLKPPAEPATPAKRKPNEPHTPKKLAAAGKKVQKPSRRNRPEREPTDLTGDRPTVYSGDRPARPSKRAASTKDTSHGIPRRSGSALSLRAGARRGAIGSTVRKRASVKR
jgi:RNA-binding protein